MPVGRQGGACVISERSMGLPVMDASSSCSSGRNAMFALERGLRIATNQNFRLRCATDVPSMLERRTGPTPARAFRLDVGMVDPDFPVVQETGFVEQLQIQRIGQADIIKAWHWAL